MLHHGEVDRLAADSRELPIEHFGEFRPSDVVLNYLQVIANGRFITSEGVENGSRFPDENSAVPIEVAAGDVLFRDSLGGLFAEFLYGEHAFLYTLAAFDIAERFGRVGRLNAEGHERLRLGFDQGCGLTDCL